MSASETNRSYEDAVLKSWADTHKRGGLTLLIMLALVEQPAWSAEIRAFIDDISDNRLGVDDQSLHRALRRLENLNLITHKTVAAIGTGAKRKIYALTEAGAYTLKRYLTTTVGYERHERYRRLVQHVINDQVPDDQ